MPRKPRDLQDLSAELRGEWHQAKDELQKIDAAEQPGQKQAELQERILGLLVAAACQEELQTDTPRALPTVGDWFQRVIALAEDWSSYYVVPGVGPLVSDLDQHRIAQQLFTDVLQRRPTEELLEGLRHLIQTLLEAKRERTPPPSAYEHPPQGLLSYFATLAHAFARFQGDLPSGVHLAGDIRPGVSRGGPKFRAALDPQGSEGTEAPQLMTFSLNTGANLLVHKRITGRNATLKLQSTDRTRLLLALADWHGPIPGPSLKEILEIGKPDRIVHDFRAVTEDLGRITNNPDFSRVPALGQEEENPFAGLLESAHRQGYWLRPGTRIVPQRARPFRLTTT